MLQLVLTQQNCLGSFKPEHNFPEGERYHQTTAQHTIQIGDRRVKCKLIEQLKWKIINGQHISQITLNVFQKFLSELFWSSMPPINFC